MIKPKIISLSLSLTSVGNDSAILSHSSALNNSDIPKPHHRINKLLKKQTFIPTKRLNDPPRPIIPQKRLIGDEHSFSGDNPLVVIIIEHRRGGVEELAGVPVGVRLGALPPQLRRQPRLEARVGVVAGAEVAEAALERGAVRETQSMAAGERHQVLDGESPPREALDQLRGVQRRRR